MAKRLSDGTIQFTEKEILDGMKKFKTSREEAIEALAYDYEIDHGGKDLEFDLTEEQQAVVRELNQKVEHKKGGKQGQNNHKPNELKEAIVQELAQYLESIGAEQDYDEVKIVNANRLISFSVGEKKFDLTLVEKRPPKKKENAE